MLEGAMLVITTSLQHPGTKMAKQRQRGPAQITALLFTSSATQPPCPKLGVMGCAASPTRVIRPEPKGCPGFSHLHNYMQQHFHSAAVQHLISTLPTTNYPFLACWHSLLTQMSSPTDGQNLHPCSQNWIQNAPKQEVPGDVTCLQSCCV